MLFKTKGIVLKTTEYAEASLVVRIYTELFGMQSYLVNSVRKKNARIRQSTLHPLSLLDLVVYHKENKSLHRIAEIKVNPVLSHLPFDLRKNSIAIFINEVILKSIAEQEPNEKMFGFLFEAVQQLDNQQPVNPDFPLLFAILFTRHLGFYPHPPGNQNFSCFNLLSGVFTSELLPANLCISGEELTAFYNILSSYTHLAEPTGLPYELKKHLLEKMMQYYAIHLPAFHPVKSLPVLHEIWH